MKKILPLLLIVMFSCKTRIIYNEFNDYDDTTTTVVESKIESIPNGSTVLYFIRHSEISDENRDPNLSFKGKQSAQRYATYFKDKKLDSIYTTNFNRTRETAETVAENSGMPYEYYNPNHIDVELFLKNNKGNHILFVGHSNTVPKSVNSFIGKMKYTQILEDEFDEIYRVMLTNGNTLDDVLSLSHEIKLINKLKLEQQQEEMKLQKKMQRKQRRQKKNI